MTTIQLGDILTGHQCDEVLSIMLASSESVDRVRKLKEYLIPMREQLESKGVVPEYLAYMLEALYLKRNKNEH